MHAASERRHMLNLHDNMNILPALSHPPTRVHVLRKEPLVGMPRRMHSAGRGSGVSTDATED